MLKIGSWSGGEEWEGEAQLVRAGDEGVGWAWAWV